MSNPIQYTSRTFASILADINNDADLVDKPNWFKRLIAGLGDLFSLNLNATANNLLLETAYTRENVLRLLELIDYQLVPQTTSSGALTFYFPGSVVFPFTIAIDDLVGLTAGTTSVSSKRFEGRAVVNVVSVAENFAPAAVNTGTDVITVTRDFTTGEKVRFTTTNTLPSPLATGTDYYVINVSATEIKVATSLANALAGTNIDLTTQGVGTHTITLYCVDVTCYQQQTVDSYIAGESDGLTEWQSFDLKDIDVLEDTVVVEINSVQWTKVDTFVDSISTDKHYRILYYSDNSSKIEFGNGTYGAIPGAFDVYVSYAIGGNSDSNISSLNRINIYGGADSNVNAVANLETFTGGSDPETIAEAKRLGPLLLKARNRFVTTDDGIALASAYSGIATANVVKNFYGVLSAKVVCIANGGGNPSGAIQTALQQYLIDRTVLEGIDVRVENTTITSTAVTSAAKVLTGYTWAQVLPWFRLGWKLFLSESGQEIYDDYLSNGVDSARTLINTIFLESYTSADNTQIQNFMAGFTARAIGENDIQESDAFAFLAGRTIGVDYMTITLPAFPIALADDEITTYGALTLTEIP